MPVDTSIYGKTPPALNPIQTYGSLANTQNLVNQNKLFQQTFKDKAALSGAYQGAIDPQTGSVNYEKVIGSLSTNGMGYLVPEAVKNLQEQQQRQLGIDKTALEKNIIHLNTMRGALGTLTANPNVSQKDVINSVADLVAKGVLTPQMATSTISTIPQDPQALKGWLQDHLLNNLGSAERLNAIAGQIQTINTGDQQHVLAVSPVTGARTIGTLQNKLSPEAATTPTPMLVRNPDGTMSPSNVTRAQFAGMANQGPVATAPALTATGLTPSEATTPTPAFVNGQPVAVTRQAFADAAGGGTPIATGPKLGQAPAADVTGRVSAEQGVALNQMADSVPARKAALSTMEQTLGKFESGPSAEATKELKALAGRFGLTPDSVREGVAAQEEFTKLGTQIALQQLQTLGTGTDEKLGTAIKANPSTALSKLGNQQIIQLLKGNEDALAVKNQEWQKWLGSGNGPETYGQFSTQFNKTFDPRVFQSIYMTTDQMKKMVDAMSDPEKKALQTSYNTAVERGWIPDPRAPK